MRKMKRSVIVALVVSLLVHGALALALVAYFEYAPQPDSLATLDLSSVELSFAEQVDESAAVAPSPPSPPVRAEPRPMRDENPPEAKPGTLRPPEAGEVVFSVPKEDVKLTTEDAKAAQSPQADRTIQNDERANDSSVAPQQARINAPPRPLRTIRPVYPRGARRRGEQGEVELEVSVGADGEVESVTVVRSSGFAELDVAAVQASRKARFTPARSGNAAVSSRVRLPFNFKLK